MHILADEVIDYCLLPTKPHEAMQIAIVSPVEQLRFGTTVMRASKRHRATEAEAALSGNAEDFGIGRIIWLLLQKWVGRG